MIKIKKNEYFLYLSLYFTVLTFLFFVWSYPVFSYAMVVNGLIAVVLLGCFGFDI